MIVVVASTGGVLPLRELVRPLRRDFPAALFIVLHIPSYSPSVLPQLLNSVASLHAKHPDDSEFVERSVIYVAPPDRHLLVERGRVRVSHGPRENRHRPAIDPLFGRRRGRTAIALLEYPYWKSG
jgi:two-component system chemotaxis response regulator CheB